mmetsp:Transcript_10820/g.32467  ORF Transcript_10820/g.32467 Transcript_10820/m.32467 type:complete len:449 (-) Transcript_10820:2900-4246(-)
MATATRASKRLQAANAAGSEKKARTNGEAKRGRQSSSPAAQKRRRTPSPEPQPQEPPDKRQKRAVARPGVPPPTRLSSFIVPNRPSPPLRGADKDGHFVFELGDNISSRYKILSKMGEGTFGRVLECWDRKHKSYCAIKVVRNIKKYRDAAMIELEVLKTLEANDPEGEWHCVTLKEWFDYRGHVCMVFERLGLSLYDFLRKNSYRPFAHHIVVAFGRQLLEAVAFLHDLGLIHTDLKPENILLQSPAYQKKTPPPGSRLGRRIPSSDQVKVIDFGSATFEDQYHSTIVSTRHYRAPEVILGLGWTFPCDLWSCGCILVELATGDALFQTHENLEHLAMMEAVLGQIPQALGREASRDAEKYFRHGGKLAWPEAASSRKSVRAVQRMNPLHKHIAAACDASLKPVLPQLVDLLKKLMVYDPAKRIDAVAALRHDFFSQPVDPVTDSDN